MTEVESAEIGQAYRGVIVHATGYAPLEGYHLPELRFRSAAPDAAGMIELEFVARAPEMASVGGGTASRRLVAAQFVPQALLDQARGIRVIAAENSREVPLVRPPNPARRPAG